MLVMSLGACLVSLVPLIAKFFGVPEAALWTASSLVLGALCAGYWLIANRLRRRVTRVRPGLLSSWAQAVVIASLTGAIVLQALNVAAVILTGARGHSSPACGCCWSLRDCSSPFWCWSRCDPPGKTVHPTIRREDESRRRRFG